MFFATTNDLRSVLSALETAEPVQYVQAGLCDTDILQIHLSHTTVPDLGRCFHPSAVGNPRYLVSPRGSKMHVRAVPQQSGGVLFAVDQLINPDTFAMRPGGRYGQDVMLSGMIGTVSQSKAAVDLYTSAAKAFRKTCTRHEELLLGPESLELWDSGVRLTR